MKKKNLVILSCLFLFAASLAFETASTPSNVALFWIIKTEWKGNTRRTGRTRRRVN